MIFLFRNAQNLWPGKMFRLSLELARAGSIRVFVFFCQMKPEKSGVTIAETTCSFKLSLVAENLGEVFEKTKGRGLGVTHARRV